MNKIVPVNEEYTPDDGVMISEMDINGVITFANRKLCEVSAYKLSELVGMNNSMIIHPDMPNSIYTKLWQTLRDSQTWNGIVQNIRKDGRYFWSETEIIPLYNESDELKGFMSAKRVASKKNIEEAKELYNKMLED